MRPEADSDPENRGAGRRRQGGFALVAAVALLVVLGSMGAVMLRMSGLEQGGASAAVLGTRAHWAARSGLEWAIHEAIANGGCPASTPTTLTLTEGALSGFSVAVTCSSTPHREGSEDRVSLVIGSQARFGSLGSRDFVFRDLQAALVL